MTVVSIIFPQKDTKCLEDEENSISLSMYVRVVGDDRGYYMDVSAEQRALGASDFTYSYIQCFLIKGTKNL